MRTGPGTRYPIEWVYSRQGLPVEITAEYDIWRRVRDAEGTEGWVHKNEISGKRAVIVIGAAGVMHDLRDAPAGDAGIKAHLESGAIGQVSSCARDWCNVKFNGIKGYLPKSDFWGAYPAEIFD
jgi:SH3-like domain-containing protein